MILWTLHKYSEALETMLVGHHLIFRVKRSKCNALIVLDSLTPTFWQWTIWVDNSSILKKEGVLTYCKIHIKNLYQNKFFFL